MQRGVVINRDTHRILSTCEDKAWNYREILRDLVQLRRIAAHDQHTQQQLKEQNHPLCIVFYLLP